MKKISQIAAAVAVFAVALTGCVGTSNNADTPTASSTPTDGTFPQTVETAFGEVTIDAAPQRIVALGWGDAETALAFGYQPVGASDWLEFGGDGVGPWAEGLYDQSPEIIATLEPSYEAIAALDPDLILDVRGSGDQDRHDRLSEIAPTVGVPEGGQSYLTTQEQQIDMISTALGVPEKGDELRAEIDTAYKDAADAHPEWAGKTVTAAARTSKGWGAYVEGSNRVQTLERLGFVQNPAIADLPANSGGFSVSISSEQLGLMDADLVIVFPIYIDTTEVTDDAQWNAIPAVADGRSIVMDGDISDAYSLGSPQAALYTVKNLTPLLEKAIPAS